MKDEKDRTGENEKRSAAGFDARELIPEGLNPYLKGVLVVGGIVFVVWVSQYVFLSFAGAIREFKTSDE